jgi:hypothetical protein
MKYQVMRKETFLVSYFIETDEIDLEVIRDLINNGGIDVSEPDIDSDILDYDDNLKILRVGSNINKCDYCSEPFDTDIYCSECKPED